MIALSTLLVKDKSDVLMSTSKTDHDDKASWVTALEEVRALLDAAGIRYWLDTGTLLGAIREGKFISWDDDIDLSIEVSDSSKLLRLTKEFARLGYRIDVTDSSIYLSGKGKTKIGIAPYQREGDKIWNLFLVQPPRYNWLFKYLRRVADKIIYQPYQQGLPWLEQALYTVIPEFTRWWVRRWFFNLTARLGEKHIPIVFPAHFVDQLSTVKLSGMSLPAPSQPEEFLALIYGDDWRIPRTNWQWEDVKAIDYQFFRGRDRYYYTMWGADHDLDLQIIRRFNELGDRVVESQASATNFELQAILRELGTPGQDMNLLDIGAGKGKLAGHLQEKGFHVTGVEPAPKLLAIARQQFPTVNFIEGSATRLPVGDNSFDIVICVEVLEHIPDTKQALQEMQRVLKPGGRAVIIDKNINSLHPVYLIPTRIWKWLWEVTGHWMYPLGFPFREKYFVPRQLLELMQSCFVNASVDFIRFTPDTKLRAPLKRIFWLIHGRVTKWLYQVARSQSFYVIWQGRKPNSL